MASQYTEVYSSEKFGNDDSGDGSCDKPYKTLSKVMVHVNGEVAETTRIWIDGDETEKWAIVPKSRLKKAIKSHQIAEKKLQKEKEKAEKEHNTQQIGDQSVSIIYDTALDEATQAKINQLPTLKDKVVKVYGWVHHLRRQGKNLMFLLLRDGTGYLQCVISGDQCKTSEALQLSVESSICIYGTISQVPVGKAAPGGIELTSSYWMLIGDAPAGGVDNVLTKDSEVDILFDNRHLVLRGTNTSNMMKMVSKVLRCFRDHFDDRGYTEVLPPTLVQTQVEGGGDLFELNYFGESAYLAQSAQLYLETCVPSVGDSFSITRSYRAEKSRTRRHLSEYNHVEAECPFITFDDLLNKIEDLVVDVTDRVDEKAGDLIREINPNFKKLKKPFKRLRYSDAINYVNSLGLRRAADGEKFEFGDDIPEAPERKMVEAIGEPVLLTHFPKTLKAFYMQPCEDDPLVTESVDLLIPGVGEIVGGSMRMTDKNKLLDGYKREEINPEPYYWYTQQREYGTCAHGGYGLGFERFCTWIMGQDHIREVCLYPRFTGRCRP